ncbi:micronuclear linker histone polyprotein-like [Ptychodera flava]|uniref:micronuclear linker histone polyprotein-like n=1 Tax=Ptychodera flava TaxID=63121 RepID=UPI00396A6AAC
MEDREMFHVDDDDVDGSKSASNRDNNNKLFYFDESQSVKSPKELLGEDFTSIAEYNAHLARQIRRQEQSKLDDCVNDKYRMERLGEKQWKLMYCDKHDDGIEELRLTCNDINDQHGLDKTDWEKKLNFKFADDSDDDSLLECKETEKYRNVEVFNDLHTVSPFKVKQNARLTDHGTDIESDMKTTEINHNASQVSTNSSNQKFKSNEKVDYEGGQGCSTNSGLEAASDGAGAGAMEEKHSQTEPKRFTKTPIKKKYGENGSSKSNIGSVDNGQTKTNLTRTGSRNSIGCASPSSRRKSSKYTTSVEITLGAKDGASGAVVKGNKVDSVRSTNTHLSRVATEPIGRARSSSGKKTASPTQVSKNPTRESRAQTAQQEKHIRTGSMSPPKVTYRRSASCKNVRSRSVGPNVLLPQNGDKTFSVQQKRAAWEAKSKVEKEKVLHRQQNDLTIQRKSSEKRKSIVAERKAMLLGNVTNSDQDVNRCTNSGVKKSNTSMNKTEIQEPNRRSLPPTPVRKDTVAHTIGLSTRPKTSSRKDRNLSVSKIGPTSVVAGKNDCEQSTHSLRTLSSSSTGSLKNSPTSKSSPTTYSSSGKSTPINVRKSDEKPGTTSKYSPPKSMSAFTSKRRTPPPIPVKPDSKANRKRISATCLLENGTSPAGSTEKKASPFVTTEKRASPTGSMEKRASPTGSMEKRASPTGPMDKRASPTGSMEKRTSSIRLEKKASVSTEKRTCPTMPTEKKASPTVPMEKRISANDPMGKQGSSSPNSNKNTEDKTVSDQNEGLDEVDSSHKPECRH